MAPPLAPGAKPAIPGAWPIPSECDSTAAIIAEFYRRKAEGAGTPDRDVGGRDRASLYEWAGYAAFGDGP